MNAPLARYLTHFNQPPPPAFVDQESVAPQIYLTLTPEELDSQLSAARREATEALAAAHEAQVTELIERLRADAAAEREAARESWAAEEGARLAVHLDEALGALEAAFAEHACNVVRPWLAEAAALRAKAAFAEAFDSLLSDPDHPALILKGPPDLIAALRAERPDIKGVVFEESFDVEATLVADGMKVETRLAATLSMLKED